MLQTHESTERVDFSALPSDFYEKLQYSMMNEHHAVNSETNPVAVALREGDGATNEYRTAVAREYTVLPQEIVSLLGAARDQAEAVGAADVVAALERNIAEERGSKTGNKPHVDILIDGAREQGLELTSGEPLEETRQFIATLKGYLAEDPHKALGVAYALEASAVPELRIVKQLLEAEIGDLQDDLADFFARHIDEFEPGHESELREAIGDSLDNDNKREQFVSGFEQAMSAMDVWWTAMDEKGKDSPLH